MIRYPEREKERRRRRSIFFFLFCFHWYQTRHDSFQTLRMFFFFKFSSLFFFLILFNTFWARPWNGVTLWEQPLTLPSWLGETSAAAAATPSREEKRKTRKRERERELCEYKPAAPLGCGNGTTCFDPVPFDGPDDELRARHCDDVVQHSGNSRTVPFSTGCDDI